MPALVCSLSGSLLTRPVLSSKTGHLYQKSTILHYISVHGTCPHTGVPLDKSHLIDLASTNTQVLPNQPNIPSLAQKVSSEMDVMILEGHLLRQRLRERRQELAGSLYRQDAAIRVIATLRGEREKRRVRVGELMKEIGKLQNE